MLELWRQIVDLHPAAASAAAAGARLMEFWAGFFIGGFIFAIIVVVAVGLALPPPMR